MSRDHATGSCHGTEVAGEEGERALPVFVRVGGERASMAAAGGDPFLLGLTRSSRERTLAYLRRGWAWYGTCGVGSVDVPCAVPSPRRFHSDTVERCCHAASRKMSRRWRRWHGDTEEALHSTDTCSMIEQP